jgi:hypothetical protein
MGFVHHYQHGDPPAGVTRWNNPTYLGRALESLAHVNETLTALLHLKERFSQYTPGYVVMMLLLPIFLLYFLFLFLFLFLFSFLFLLLL